MSSIPRPSFTARLCAGAAVLAALVSSAAAQTFHNRIVNPAFSTLPPVRLFDIDTVKPELLPIPEWYAIGDTAQASTALRQLVLGHLLPPDGVKLWFRTYRLPNRSITGYSVVGSIEPGVSFGAGDTDAVFTGSPTFLRNWIGRFDPAGTPVWVRVYNSAATPQIAGPSLIEPESDGRPVLVDRWQSGTGAAFRGLFIKVDRTTGAPVLQRIYIPQVGFIVLNDVVEVPGGELVIAGTISGSTATGTTDILLMRTDPLGVIIAAVRIGSPDFSERSIALDRVGPEIVLLARTTDGVDSSIVYRTTPALAPLWISIIPRVVNEFRTIQFDPTDFSVYVGGERLGLVAPAVVYKLDPAGGYLWSREYGAPDPLLATKIQGMSGELTGFTNVGTYSTPGPEGWMFRADPMGEVGCLDPRFPANVNAYQLPIQSVQISTTFVDLDQPITLLDAPELEVRKICPIVIPCPEDIDGDGDVDADDIFAFLAIWFAAPPGSPCIIPPFGCPGDWDGDGFVDADDIFAYLASWFAFGPGMPCP